MRRDGPILITGAEGFAGRALGGYLKAAWPDAVLLGTTRTGEAVAGFDAAHEVDLTHGDVAGAIRRLRPVLVYHLAARSSVAQSLGAGDLTFTDNVTAAMRLAAAMRAEVPGVPLVFASSGEVYGRGFLTSAPIGETQPPLPQNAYARSKLAGEFAFADILAPVSPVVVLRLFNHFGPGQDERFVIPAFAAQLKRIAAGVQPPEILTGNLDAVRDFLPLADVLRAYRAAGERAMAGAPGLAVFNVASGNGRSIRSVLEELIGLSGLEVTLRLDPARLRPSEIPLAVGDSTAFRTAAGWAPEADWRDALAAMLLQPVNQ